MPIFGLGVFRSAAGGEAQQAVGWAIKHGYVHIDTAALYRNEEDVGKAIKESGIQRDNIFVTTKVVIKIVCVSQYISYQYRFGTLSMATRRL
jgi:diketogulonate reductase-like aldo/keto reductase